MGPILDNLLITYTHYKNTKPYAVHHLIFDSH